MQTCRQLNIRSKLRVVELSIGSESSGIADASSDIITRASSKNFRLFLIPYKKRYSLLIIGYKKSYEESHSPPFQRYYLSCLEESFRYSYKRMLLLELFLWYFLKVVRHNNFQYPAWRLYFIYEIYRIIFYSISSFLYKFILCC